MTSVEKSVLPSGTTLVTQTVPDRQSVSVGIWVRTGSRDEPREHLGLAHFVEHMMFKGTQTRDARAIAGSLESLGGSLDAFTTREQVCYTARVLSEHVPQAIEVLSDLLCRSKYDPLEIEREKSVVKEEILSYEDSPEDRVSENLSAQVWGDHGLGRPILGFADTVDALTRDVIRADVDRRYRADQLIVAAAGGMEHAALVDLVTRHLTPAQGEAPARGSEPPAFTPSVKHEQDDVQQLYLSLGTRAVPYSDPRRYGLIVLETLLGGGMSSRLFQSIREEAGLAYSIFSSLDFLRDGGMFSIHLGVTPDKGRQALALLREELTRIAEAGPDAAEVSAAVMQLKGSIVMGQESCSSRMYHVARQELYLGQYTPPERQVERLLAVTREEVAGLAAEFLRPGRFSLSALGPADGEPLGEAEWPLER